MTSKRLGFRASGFRSYLSVVGPVCGLVGWLASGCSGRDQRAHRLSAESSEAVVAARAFELVAEPAESEPSSLQSRAEPPAAPVECLPPTDEHVVFQLVATARRTPVFARPDSSSTQLGYLRAGQVVTRSAMPTKGAGCVRGYYAIEPRGYVCVGVDASLNLEHPARYVNLGTPDLESDMPYVYGLSRFPTPPIYTRVPTAAEQSRTEPNIERYLPRRDMSQWLALGFDELPEFLEDHAPSFHTSGIRKGQKALTEGQAFVESGFAFVRRFHVGGRAYGLTTNLEVLPLDRLNWVKGSEFRGVELSEQMRLPLAFIRDDGATLRDGEPDVGLRPGRALAHREAVSLNGVRHTYGGRTYWQTTDGAWLEHTSRVTVVEPRKAYPGWSEGGRTWIDVSLLQQTLVAYRGREAKYVTLVSTGRDGTSDAETTNATLQGQFVIHTKHLTSPMTSSGESGAFDLRDVPYVQYFSGGYALHAAYWHDDFGQPKSHGCINLSPRDAKWLFGWTQPALPERWHGVLSEEGTWINIHP